MKARDVTVNVVDFGGELYIMATMKLKGISLSKEENKVVEKSRRLKIKEIKSVMEAVDFPFTVSE